MRRWNHRRGFTLTELMVAMAILAILAAIIIPNFIQRMDRAREASTKGNMSTLQLMAEDYAIQNSGTYSDVLDAGHIANLLPTNFRNPFDDQQGNGHAWEDRATFSAPPTPIPGIASYADSDTVCFNVKGHGKAAPLRIVLASGK